MRFYTVIIICVLTWNFVFLFSYQWSGHAMGQVFRSPKFGHARHAVDSHRRRNVRVGSKLLVNVYNSHTHATRPPWRKTPPRHFNVLCRRPPFLPMRIPKYLYLLWQLFLQHINAFTYLYDIRKSFFIS